MYLVILIISFAHIKLTFTVIFFIYQQPPIKVICLPEDNCFGRYFTHSQFQLPEVFCIVAMLIGAIDVLSGGLHMYF